MSRRKPVPSKSGVGMIPINRKRFVEEYLMIGCRCASEAAQNAGVPKDQSRQRAHEWLRDPQVQAEIDAWEEDREKYVRFRAAAVVEELANVARANIKDIVEKSDDGTFRLRDDVPEWAWSAVKKITKKRASTEGDKGDSNNAEFSVEMHDKVRALQLLAQCAGMLSNKVEVTGKVSMMDIILASMEG